MTGTVHLLPGTTFSDVKQKGCYYPSEARAILTLSELERWLALQIAGIFQLSLHSSLGTTPLAAWQEAIGDQHRRFASLLHCTVHGIPLCVGCPSCGELDPLPFGTIQ
jgi:hypothetical protein